MTNVFIVNNTTFNIHLQYMFAATGTDYIPSFLENPDDTTIHWSRECNLLGLIADISRIKINDQILFYLQGDKDHSGTIFGIFRAISNPFYCNNNYLQNELQKKLQYRVLIEQDEVYAKGISEYTALDSLANIEHPSQMCWSLIYRKLRGNRGCTMITDYEADRLKKLIKTSNNNTTITLPNNFYKFVYNAQSNCISTEQLDAIYRKTNFASLNIKERLLFRMNSNRAYETHLQVYILQNINQNNNLKQLIIPNINNSFWIGNEVGCGVGMQKIDILIMQLLDNILHINIIELKCINPSESIFKQLKKYIYWIKDYICPLHSDKDIKINPIIIAPFDKKLLVNSSIEEQISVNQNSIQISQVNYIKIINQNNNITFKQLT